MKFNEKLISIRKAHGYTQEKLADELGVSRQAVSRWETGETTPELALFIRICSVLNVTADFLINDNIDSEDDIPIIKQKDIEIRQLIERKNKYVFLSALCFSFGTFCTIIAIIVSSGSIQLVFSIVCTAAFLIMAVYQFAAYIKNKRSISSDK